MVKDIVKGAWSLITFWRRRTKEKRLEEQEKRREEREETEAAYEKRIAILNERLTRATASEDHHTIEQEIRIEEDDYLEYLREKTASMSRHVVRQRAPADLIPSEIPKLPPPEREALQAAATTLAALEPPKTAGDFFDLGNAFYAASEYDRALEEYNRAFELRPDEPATLTNRGNTLSHLQRYDEALVDYNRSLELDPEYVSPIYNRACAYSFMGRLEESLEQLKEAISRDPEYRNMAREDEDFGNLRSDPTLGPEFERLVAEPED